MPHWLSQVLKCKLSQIFFGSCMSSLISVKFALPLANSSRPASNFGQNLQKCTLVVCSLSEVEMFSILLESSLRWKVPSGEFMGANACHLWSNVYESRNCLGRCKFAEFLNVLWISLIARLFRIQWALLNTFPVWGDPGFKLGAVVVHWFGAYCSCKLFLSGPGPWDKRDSVDGILLLGLGERKTL